MMYKRAMLVGAVDMGGKVLAAVFTLVVIRILPVDEYAKYTYAVSLVMLLHHLASVSFNRAFILGYEELGLEGRAQGFFLAQLISVFTAGSLFLPWLGQEFGLMAVTLVLALLYATMEALKSLFQKHLQFRKYSVFELSRNFIALTLIFGAVLLGWEAGRADWVMAVQALALALPLSMFMARLRWRQMPGLAAFGFKTMARILTGPMVALVGYVIFTSLLSQMDVLLLKALGDAASLATYGVALRFYGFLMVGLQSIHFVALPAMTEAKTPAEMKKVFLGQGRLWVMIGLGLAVLFWVSPYLIPVVSGNKYPEAVGVFRLLCVSAFSSLCLSPYVNVVLRFKEFQRLILTVLGAVLIHVTVSVYAIPRLGAMGAAGATLISFLFLNVITFMRARTLLKRP